MKDKLLSKQGWVILLICIISFFINNRVVVPDIMEARNMVTAREMVHDGNWLVPTMNGDLRLEKPPLPTWLTAVAEMISPDNLALQRAMAGFAAILLVAFFYLTAVQVMRNKRYAFISTILLCTCYNIILMGRTASWDIYCHAFMMGAIYFLIRAFAAKACSWKDFTWAGVFMGLSFMSKGPVSFYALLLPFLISYCYIYRPSMKGKWKALAMPCHTWQIRSRQHGLTGMSVRGITIGAFSSKPEYGQYYCFPPCFSRYGLKKTEKGKNIFSLCYGCSPPLSCCHCCRKRKTGICYRY